MLRRRLRQFFWLSLGLSTIGVFTNMTSLFHSKFIPAIETQGKGDTSFTQPKQGTPEWDLPQVDEKGTSMVLKGKVYVKIDDGWYLKRADNTYLVKGVKTYFVNETLEGIKTNSVKPKAEEASQGLEEVAQNPIRAYSPEKVSQMMTVLKDAQAKVKVRDNALKEITDSK